MPILETLIGAVVPILVNAVSSLFQTREEKRVWVAGVLTEIVGVTDKFVPSFLKPEEALLQGLLDAAINSALDKLEGK